MNHGFAPKSASERRHHIANYVRLHGKARLDDLANMYDVSDVTIRRDLEILESQNLVHRVRGGAVAESAPPLEIMFQEKLQLYPHLKHEIAVTAASLVEDGHVVMLSAGTTTTYIARELVKKRELTVVTAAINIAWELAGYDHITLVVVGGIARRGSYATVGHMADHALTSLNADFSFVGVDGVDLQAGFTTPNLMEAHTDQMMLRAANRGIIVADHSKFRKVALSPVAKVDQASLLITDHEADPKYVEDLRSRGCHVCVSSDLTERFTAPASHL